MQNLSRRDVVSGLIAAAGLAVTGSMPAEAKQEIAPQSDLHPFGGYVKELKFTDRVGDLELVRTAPTSAANASSQPTKKELAAVIAGGLAVTTAMVAASIDTIRHMHSTQRPKNFAEPMIKSPNLKAG